MHANTALLNTLFTALQQGDYDTMASCYRADARFRDIAFDLEGVEEIRSMWRMICSTDIKVAYEIVHADDRTGRARLAETYHFDASKNPPRPGRPVNNAIESRFLFKDGRIQQQDDDCDSKSWARQAVGGIKGFLAGRIRFLRSRTAKDKLAKFVETHPEAR